MTPNKESTSNIIKMFYLIISIEREDKVKRAHDKYARLLKIFMESKNKNNVSKFLNSFKRFVKCSIFRSKLSLTSKRIHENVLNKFDKPKKSLKTKQNSTISDSDNLERNDSYVQNSLTFTNFEKKDQIRPKTSRIYIANNKKIKLWFEH